MKHISLFLVLLGTLSAGAADRPNVILCMADDHGWTDTGYQGHPFVQTPHLDAMAREGLRFDRWYAAAPVCSPTRGSCLTGRHPHRYGILSANVGHMKPEEITLAEILREAGYATGHFGKWHLGTLTREERDANRGGTEKGRNHYSPPWDNGFERSFSTESKVPTFDPMRNPPSVAREARKEVSEGGYYGTAYWTGPGRKVPDERLKGDDSELIMDQALDFISKAHQAGRPFLAVIWFHAPHTPVVAGPRHRALYPDHPHGLYGQHYHGCLSALDEQMGRLRGRLDTLGIARDTMLWYCSDNGPEGNERNGAGSAAPFRGRKRSLHEGGVRVPGLLVWPRVIEEPRTVDMPCVTSDYLPTVLDALDLPLPDRPLDGISLMPLLRGEMKERPRPIGFRYRGTEVMNDNRFKLLRRGDRIELYDLEADPSETTNLAASHPDAARDLQARLDRWLESCRRSDLGRDYRSGN